MLDSSAGTEIVLFYTYLNEKYVAKKDPLLILKSIVNATIMSTMIEDFNTFILNKDNISSLMCTVTVTISPSEIKLWKALFSIASRR